MTHRPRQHRAAHTTQKIDLAKTTGLGLRLNFSHQDLTSRQSSRVALLTINYSTNRHHAYQVLQDEKAVCLHTDAILALRSRNRTARFIYLSVCRALSALLCSGLLRNLLCGIETIHPQRHSTIRIQSLHTLKMTGNESASIRQSRQCQFDRL